jgi:ribosome-associated protein
VESPQKSLLVTLAALERSALEPVLLDIREVTSFADTVVLLSGRSDRQVRAIADAVVHALQDEGEPPLGVEGLNEGRWVLIDCNDVIVHVFLREVRDLYDLERLWSDAPGIDLVELGVPQEALTQARSEETRAAESVR